MTPDAVMRELAGLHALARSLVHGDADADDLLQDTAIAALEHPPDVDRPVRPWLATVLRNRWRMDRRGRSRREAREQAIGLDLAAAAGDVPDAIDRARTLERLASALVALDEPFRDVVIRRYLDGQSAADIARALGVPAGTVRWRLKTGLERLRAALDESTPRWQRALVPLTAVKGAALVKAKTTLFSLLLFLLLVGGGIVALVVGRGGGEPSPSQHVPALATKAPALRVAEVSGAAAGDAGTTAHPDPLPGQGRAVIEAFAGTGGAIGGRVINWSTGDPSKDALLDAVVDKLMSGIGDALAHRQTVDWIDALREAAHAYRRLAHDHPKAFPLLATRRFESTGTYAFMEQLFVLARERGIDDRVTARFYRVVSSYCNGFALNELASQQRARDARAAALRRRFPVVAAVSEWLEPEYLDELFAFGLELQLTALAQATGAKRRA